MAEEQNITDFDGIILELQRIEKIETSQEELQNKLSKTNEKIQVTEDSLKEVRQSFGIEETSKKKNVIDGDKLSSTLTTSEKKRYENIGKEFIAGAGKEFENIRRASKFKEMMSTVKKKFTVGVIEFKERINKLKKKSGFIGKLLIIIGLLGTIVALFKDKITAVLPNLSDKISEIFTSVKECIGGIINNMFQYVIQGIGTSFTNIMKEMVTNVIPKFIGTFFQVTLPNAIVNLYLGVLSAFSGDAQDLFDQRLKDDINETTDDIAENADEDLKTDAIKEADEYSSVIKQIEAAQKNIDNDTAQMSDFIAVKRDSGILSMLRDKSSEQVLEGLDKLVQGDQNFRELINSGQFNTTKFLQQIAEAKAQANGNLTNESVFNAIKESVSESVLQQGFKMSENADIKSFSDALISMSDKSAEKRKEMDSKIAELRAQEEDSRRAMTEYKQTITEINAKDAISGTLAETFSNLVKHIISFIEGDKLKNIIETSLITVNDNFNKFFKGFTESITKIVDFLSKACETAHVLVTNSYNNIKEKNGAEVISDRASKQENAISTSMNAIVNIDLSQSSPEGSIIKGIVQEVVSIDVRLSDLMKKSNENLESVITGLANIKSLHANSKDYIQQEITKRCDPIQKSVIINTETSVQNKRKINEIERQIKTPYGQPIRESYVAPCLDLS